MRHLSQNRPDDHCSEPAALRKTLAIAALEGRFPDPAPGRVSVVLPDGPSLVVDSSLLPENLREAFARHSLAGTPMEADEGAISEILSCVDIGGLGATRHTIVLVAPRARPRMTP